MKNKDNLLNYNPKAEKAKKIIKNIFIYLIMSFFAIIMLTPYYWSILTAFRTYEASVRIPVSFWPDFKTMTLDNFKYFITAQNVGFLSALGYTVLITAVGMCTNLFLGSLAGYTFAKMQFRGRKLIFRIMILSLMVPGIVTAFPTFFLLTKIGLSGTWMAVVLPGAVGVYGVFFMRQFFHSVPSALGEAARIDGAGEFRIFWQIYLPQVYSGLITFAIITFNSYWNSYMWPKMVLQGSNVKMLAQLLGLFAQLNEDVNMGSIMAGSLIITLPSLLIFAFLQKYFMNTVTFAGVKE